MGPGHERGVPGRGPGRAGPHARPRRLQRQQVRRLLHQLISGKDNKHFSTVETVYRVDVCPIPYFRACPKNCTVIVYRVTHQVVMNLPLT